jgi:hypothetical protein
MNVQLKPANEQGQASRLAVADCDIHPATRTEKDLHPWLERKWIEHMAAVRPAGAAWLAGGARPIRRRSRTPRGATPIRPRAGGRAAASPSCSSSIWMPNNVELGILNPLGSGQGANPDLSTALCHATNEWQIEYWLSKDQRLRGSVVVNYEDGPAAAAEIRRYAGNPMFVQVLLLTRTAEPLGARRYWPIYEAAQEAGLAVAVHAFGYGGNPITTSGWPSHYIEEMVGHAQTSQSVVTSSRHRGRVRAFPEAEADHGRGGCAWAPSLAWRLDKVWRTLKAETPTHARALRIHPRSCVVDEPADRGAGAAVAPGRRHRVDGLGPAAVRHRLPALGLRRPRDVPAGEARRGPAPGVLPRQREHAVLRAWLNGTSCIERACGRERLRYGSPRNCKSLAIAFRQEPIMRRLLLAAAFAALIVPAAHAEDPTFALVIKAA